MFRPRQVFLWTGASDAEILYMLGKALGLGNEYGLDRLPGDCAHCTESDQCSDPYRNTCLPSGYCGSLADNESIMAPPDCGGIESIRTFSPWDITAVRLAYGSKPIGSLVNSRGTCAAIATEGNAHIDFCDGWDDRLLVSRTATPPAVADVMASMLLDEERCLQADPVVKPSRVSYQPCDATDIRQDFRLAPTRIRGIGGLCIVAAPAQEGTKLTVEKCGVAEGAQQQWVVRDDEIRLEGTSLCATVRDAEPSGGTPIVLAPCGAAPDRQSFEAKRAQLRYGTNFCLNVSGGYPLVGSNIILWADCHVNPNNDSFYLSGPVSLAGGMQCLDADFATDELLGADCDSRPSEEWDFYF